MPRAAVALSGAGAAYAAGGGACDANAGRDRRRRAGRADAVASAASRRASTPIILENRSRDYIEQRIRAGLIEQWARDLLIETGVGERLQREAMFHDGIHLCFDGALHHIDFRKLVGKGVTIYGQQEVVKDLIARRLADGGQILFEVDDVACTTSTGDAPMIRFRHERQGAASSTATSSPAATASTASAGRAFRTAC